MRTYFSRHYEASKTRRNIKFIWTRYIVHDTENVETCLKSRTFPADRIFISIPRTKTTGDTNQLWIRV